MPDVRNVSPEDFSLRIPQIVVEAHAELASHPKWSSGREAYWSETGHDIPDLVDVHAGGIQAMSKTTSNTGAPTNWIQCKSCEMHDRQLAVDSRTSARTIQFRRVIEISDLSAA
jgi:hypothetical protein